MSVDDGLVIRVQRSRTDQLVLVQAHCTVLFVLAAVTFFASARRLERLPRDHDVWQAFLWVAAVLGLATALGPWVLPRFTVAFQRTLGAAILLAAVVGAVGSIWVVSLWALLGIQMAVAALVLAEIGMQRQALLWFWICTSVLAAVVLAYHGLVDLQPRPE